MQIQEPVNVTLEGKRVFVDVIKLKVLRWFNYPGLSGALNAIANVLIREREREI